MDRSTLQKLILVKLPLPSDFCEAIKDFFPLNPPTPTAALISQLIFERIIRGMSFQCLIVEGCEVRVRDNRGGLGFVWQKPEAAQFFFYDPSTGEPIPNLFRTPTPWLQSYQDLRERLREIWD